MFCSLYVDFFSFQDNGNGTYSWLNTQPPYNCSIASPKKESKFSGLKSYIAYQLTPSVSCSQTQSLIYRPMWL